MTLSETLPEYSGVTTRIFNEQERAYSTLDKTLPLIIEAQNSKSLSYLQKFTETHSSELLNNIHQYGAILFRGFDVNKPADFEFAMKGFSALKPMDQYFMSEPGRSVYPGTQHVFYTNSVFTTGGGIKLGGYHCENYYSTDVPSVVGFCSQQPSWFGGESGLINMTHGYNEFPKSLQDKLASKSFITGLWAVSDVAQRYGLSLEETKSFCTGAGLLFRDFKGSGYVYAAKPCVQKHLHTGKLALQVNVSIELKTLDELIRNNLSQHYSGKRWTMHRMVWEKDWVNKFESLAERVRRALLSEEVKKEYKEVYLDYLSTEYLEARTVFEQFHELLLPEEVQIIANTMSKHLALVSWNKGDILLFDNQQLLHTGMPGFGPRKVSVMMYNPLPFKYPTPQGISQYEEDPENYKTVFERLQEQFLSAS